MMFEVIEVGDGVELDCKTGTVNVYLEPTTEEGEIHIKGDDESGTAGMCDISGDTYQHKELIKKLPYGDTGTEWTGETWVVAKDQTANLAGVLTIAGVKATLDARAIATDDDWGELREEIDLPGDDNETVKVMRGPEGPDNKVSRSWAEDAARVGRYEDAETFADEFGLDVVPDEEIMEYHDLDTDHDDVDVFNSNTAV